MGVDTGGAGDQGLMFGYACDETDELMPLPIMLAHKLVRRLSEVRKAGMVNFLRPDGKSQVTVEYVNGRPARVDCVVISTQHSDAVSNREICTTSSCEEVIQHVVPASADGFAHQVPHQSHGPLRGRRADGRRRA